MVADIASSNSLGIFLSYSLGFLKLNVLIYQTETQSLLSKILSRFSILKYLTLLVHGGCVGVVGVVYTVYCSCLYV